MQVNNVVAEVTQSLQRQEPHRKLIIELAETLGSSRMIATILIFLLASTASSDQTDILEKDARSQMSRFVATCLATTDALLSRGPTKDGLRTYSLSSW